MDFFFPDRRSPLLLKWDVIILIVFDAMFTPMTVRVKAHNFPNLIFPRLRFAPVKRDDARLKGLRTRGGTARAPVTHFFQHLTSKALSTRMLEFILILHRRFLADHASQARPFRTQARQCPSPGSVQTDRHTNRLRSWVPRPTSQSLGYELAKLVSRLISGIKRRAPCVRDYTPWCEHHVCAPVLFK